MKIKYSQIVGKIVRFLKKNKIEVVRMKGSHICLNRKSSKLMRPIIIPNHKSLSPGVKNSVIGQLKAEGIDTEELEEILN